MTPSAVWTLTTLGHYLRQRMRHLGVTESHERLITARREYEDRKGDFLDWVDDPESIEAYAEDMQLAIGYIQQSFRPRYKIFSPN